MQGKVNNVDEKDMMCRIPVMGRMVKTPDGDWVLDAEGSIWADIPADVIARKLIEGFGMDAILKGADSD